MIIQCTEKDREMLVSYLKKEPVYNTFILADIEDLGFDSDVQDVYAEVKAENAWASIFAFTEIS